MRTEHIYRQGRAGLISHKRWANLVGGVFKKVLGTGAKVFLGAKGDVLVQLNELEVGALLQDTPLLIN